MSKQNKYFLSKKRVGEGLLEDYRCCHFAVTFEHNQDLILFLSQLPNKYKVIEGSQGKRPFPFPCSVIKIEAEEIQNKMPTRNLAIGNDKVRWMSWANKQWYGSVVRFLLLFNMKPIHNTKTTLDVDDEDDDEDDADEVLVKEDEEEIEEQEQVEESTEAQLEASLQNEILEEPAESRELQEVISKQQEELESLRAQLQHQKQQAIDLNKQLSKIEDEKRTLNEELNKEKSLKNEIELEKEAVFNENKELKKKLRLSMHRRKETIKLNKELVREIEEFKTELEDKKKKTNEMRLEEEKVLSKWIQLIEFGHCRSNQAKIILSQETDLDSNAVMSCDKKYHATFKRLEEIFIGRQNKENEIEVKKEKMNSHGKRGATKRVSQKDVLKKITKTN